ncbi:MAG TPA: hypothetical protein VMI54_08770 [Polyangiaceae bacterium]|nr:hypothetical protein [Polyangiaceae bacterium]
MTPRSIGWIVLLANACGPSLTTVHEGTVRFEHCYRVDLQPEVPANQRRSCWYNWVTSYTLGQPRDRIEYAESRVRALDSGDTSCRELSIGADTPPEQRQFYLVVPAPTSVHAPPPPLATVVPAHAADAADGGAAPDARAKTGDEKEPPAAGCSNRCESAWASCNDACTAAGMAECPKCRPAYTKCMRSCFQ